MPEKEAEKKKAEDSSGRPSDEEADGTWAEDIRKRGYYYDDAHGYEEFDPEAEESDEE